MCSHVRSAEIVIIIMIVIRWFRFGRKKEQKMRQPGEDRGKRKQRQREWARPGDTYLDVKPIICAVETRQ